MFLTRFEVLMGRADRTSHRILASAPNQQELLDALAVLYPLEHVVYVALRDTTTDERKADG